MFRKADGLPEAGVLWTGQGPNDEAGRPLIESPAETACGTGGFDVCLQAVAAGFRETVRVKKRMKRIGKPDWPTIGIYGGNGNR